MTWRSKQDTDSFAGSTLTPRGECFEISHPISGQKIYIVPYNSGFAIEYKGTIEMWVDDFSVHNNNRGGSVVGQPARHWVGDNLDLGGIMLTAVLETHLDGGGAPIVDDQWTEVVSQRFSGASHGGMRFVTRSTGDGWQFRRGPIGNETVVADIDTMVAQIAALTARVTALEGT